MPPPCPRILRHFSSSAQPWQLAAVCRREPGMVFLDAAAPYDDEPAYSIIAWRPFMTFRSTGRRIDIVDCRRGSRDRVEGDPFAVMNDGLVRFGARREPGPYPFCGGIIGYWGYDLARHIERLPDAHAGEEGPADCQAAGYDRVVVYDHARREYGAVISPPAGADADGESETNAWLADVAARLRAAEAVSSPAPPAPAPGGFETFPAAVAERFRAGVSRIREYIAAGDIFQANLSERLEFVSKRDPWDLYLELRARNPAPFAAYLPYDDMTLLSASPERFLRRRGATVETRPIKGTRRRQIGENEDAVRRELAAAGKDRAELAMIVDVERNDLGRVCRPGSVKVAGIEVETLPTLYHLVATIVGELEAGVAWSDLLRATFPSGSITGAPKIRAMEIIDELETCRRGPYCGAIGSVDFSGNLDLSIGIRQIQCRGDHAYVPVGAGIVADSDPHAECREIDAKAAVFRQILDPR